MIRDYDRSRDTDRILHIFHRASLLAHPFLTPGFLEKTMTDIREVYLPEVQTFVLCPDPHTEPVAFISLMGSEVAALFALPEVHGRGHGRALMDHAVHRHGARDVVVFRDNDIGRRFYARYGFVEKGEFLHEETGQACLAVTLPDPAL